MRNPFDPNFDPDAHAAFERLSPAEKINAIADKMRRDKEADEKRKQEEQTAEQRQADERLAESQALIDQFRVYVTHRATPSVTHSLKLPKRFGRRQESIGGWVLDSILYCNNWPVPDFAGMPATNGGRLPHSCDSVNHKFVPLWVANDGRLYCGDEPALPEDIARYSPDRIAMSIAEYVRQTGIDLA